jgi:hypothetical protein
MAWCTAEVSKLEGTERKQQKDCVTCAMKCKMLNTSLYVEVKLQDIQYKGKAAPQHTYGGTEGGKMSTSY